MQEPYRYNLRVLREEELNKQGCEWRSHNPQQAKSIQFATARGQPPLLMFGRVSKAGRPNSFLVEKKGRLRYAITGDYWHGAVVEGLTMWLARSYIFGFLQLPLRSKGKNKESRQLLVTCTDYCYADSVDHFYFYIWCSLCYSCTQSLKFILMVTKNLINKLHSHSKQFVPQFPSSLTKWMYLTFLRLHIKRVIC